MDPLRGAPSRSTSPRSTTGGPGPRRGSQDRSRERAPRPDGRSLSGHPRWSRE
jgi:hypothetical protein